MELCTGQAISNFPRLITHSISHIRFQQFRSNFCVSDAYGFNLKLSGFRDYTHLSLKASSSDESSVSPYANDGSDSVITLEDNRPVEKEEYVEKVSYAAPEEVSNAAPEEIPNAASEEVSYAAPEEVSNAAPEEQSPEDNLQQVFESVLGKLNIEKLDSDEKYSLLVLGAGALTGLYLVTAVVGAIDSIPLVPKLMQIVGVGYTAWFTSRYLVLKESREELAARIKEIKDQIIGSDDE